MVGNNTPVFFIRDPLKFADFITAVKYADHIDSRGVLVDTKGKPQDMGVMCSGGKGSDKSALDTVRN